MIFQWRWGVEDEKVRGLIRGGWNRQETDDEESVWEPESGRGDAERRHSYMQSPHRPVIQNQQRSLPAVLQLTDSSRCGAWLTVGGAGRVVPGLQVLGSVWTGPTVLRPLLDLVFQLFDFPRVRFKSGPT